MDEGSIQDFLNITLIIINFAVVWGIVIVLWKVSRQPADDVNARRQDINVVVPEARLNIESFEEESMNGGENYDCAICLADFHKGGRSTLLCACNHKFHSDCINFWLAIHRSCPVCRTAVKVVSSSLPLPALKVMNEDP